MYERKKKGALVSIRTGVVPIERRPTLESVRRIVTVNVCIGSSVHE